MTATTSPARAGTGVKVVAFVITAALALASAAVLFVMLIISLNGYTGSEADPILWGFFVAGVATAVGGGLLAALLYGPLRRARPGWLAFAVTLVLSMTAAVLLQVLAIGVLIAAFPAG